MSAEVYRQLRSQILPQMKSHGWRTLARPSQSEVKCRQNPHGCKFGNFHLRAEPDGDAGGP